MSCFIDPFDRPGDAVLSQRRGLLIVQWSGAAVLTLRNISTPRACATGTNPQTALPV